MTYISFIPDTVFPMCFARKPLLSLVALALWSLPSLDVVATTSPYLRSRGDPTAFLTMMPLPNSSSPSSPLSIYVSLLRSLTPDGLFSSLFILSCKKNIRMIWVEKIAQDFACIV
ncbi:hypothetical protein KFK09_018968 [Dendrobium nobile]|uniref:Uncharacterized protein n=1 Tax=Dendrobium nobile TaxID=94219 RepID=A0A8T3AYK5_DENNO|nr:hypothetical protein KFK09_018968 [Dendrobium nobile]